MYTAVCFIGAVPWYNTLTTYYYGCTHIFWDIALQETFTSGIICPPVIISLQVTSATQYKYNDVCIQPMIRFNKYALGKGILVH